MKLLCLLVATASVLFSSGAASAQANFYKGKTIRIIVGSAAGGRSDRVVARHLGKHIPGQPAIIVEEMTARNHVVANRFYREAKPDGLTIGHLIGGLVLAQILGRSGIEFDARKLQYLGVAQKDNPVCAFTKASGITSIEKWIVSKTPVKLAGAYPGSITDDVPKILKAALGLPIDLVSGYMGTSDVRQAIESGAVAGGCWRWDGIKTFWSKEIQSGDAEVVLQILPKPHPDLPRVPLAVNLAKTEKARQLIQAGIHDTAATSRFYALAPGTPKERVGILRKAFTDTMKDPEFLADDKESRLDVDPVSGEQVQRTIARLFKMKPSLVTSLKEILLDE